MICLVFAGLAGPALGGPQVVLATRDLPLASRIGADDVELGDGVLVYPVDAGFASVDEVVGRTVRARILAGDPIRSERLARSEQGLGLPALIPRGMRAIRLPVDAGIAVPGDHVDLYATHEGLTEPAWMAAWVLELHDDGLTVVVTPEGTLPLLLDPAALDAVVRHPASVLAVAQHGTRMDLGPVPEGSGPQVTVAAVDLTPGVPISVDVLMQIPLAEGAAVPAGWLGAEDLVGKVLAERVVAGEPIRMERVAGPESSASIPYGKVAVAGPEGSVFLGPEAVADHIQATREAP